MQRRWLVAVALVSVFVVAAANVAQGAPTPPSTTAGLLFRSIDGSGNNLFHPTWGQAGTNYLRVAPTHYKDGIGTIDEGPNARYVSNRVFNDVGQNLFSENDISQWGWAWGQFLDHDFGLRDETPAETNPIAFSSTDPLESFHNDFGALDFSRTPAAPGTGTSVRNPRQQRNTITSYLDSSVVYGSNTAREEWERAGSVDGNPTNNSALLMLPGGYLPTVGARGNASTAPPVDLMGQLVGHPDQAVVAGDVRANENIALTAIQTLFAREHNRIVGLLPNSLTDEQKFQIARRLVNAEEQYITYNEFLPALGVRLSPYRGYDPRVDPSLSNEFATVGFRAHSMVHGEFEVDFQPGDYSAAQLASFEQQGVEVEQSATEHVLGVPLSAAFGNPNLVKQIGLGPVLTSLSEHQYKNDEQIDNTMRSVLFEVPKPGTTDPAACQTPVVDPNCFTGVADLGADDVERGRDHGMPRYNDLRRAYGLPPVTAFTQLTGEATDAFPPGLTINSPGILDFTKLTDIHGNNIPLGSDAAGEDAVNGVRRTTLAARLEAIYGTVDRLDAFVGMVSERHVPGTEFGPLQLAIWRQQFTASRDGDRFFYAGDSTLAAIVQRFHVDYRTSLSHLVFADTGEQIPAQAFRAGTVAPTAASAAPTVPAVAPVAPVAPQVAPTSPPTSAAPPSSTDPGGTTTTTGETTMTGPTTTTSEPGGPAPGGRPVR